MMNKKVIMAIWMSSLLLSSCGHSNSSSSTSSSGNEISSESSLSIESTQSSLPLDPEDVEMSKDDRLYSEMWRPQFHFSDPDSWLNDPNGLVYADGVWHMYYQATPHNPAGGVKYWGHATSDDLVHWKFHDYPLVPDKTGDMWSGTAITDPENNSGFFDDIDKTGIIAAYSTHKQTIGLAISKDGGATFEKFDERRPIVPNPGANDFRDPCIFYYPEDECWKMVTAGGIVRIYESYDLTSWELISTNSNINTECPCFFRITTEDTKEEKWVLCCSSRGYYVGSFDGITFTPETKYIGLNSNLDSYAGIIFNDAPENRVIMLNWMANISGGYMFAEGKWSQQMTLPVEYKLYTDSKYGYRLKQDAVSELNCLRREILKELHDVDTTNKNVLENVKSNTFEMNVEIDLSQSENFSMSFAKDNKGTDEIKLSYDISSNKLTLDRSKNKYGFANMTQSNSKYNINIEPNSFGEDNVLKLHIYFDINCIEIFVNDGYHYIPMKCNPFTSSRGMSIDGSIHINNLILYEMGSSWFNYKENINGVHLANSSKLYVKVGESASREVASFNGAALDVESSDENIFTAKYENDEAVVTGVNIGTANLIVKSGLRYKEIIVNVYDGEGDAVKEVIGDLTTINANVEFSPFDLTLVGGSGDGFAISKLKVGEKFTFSTDAILNSGTAAAILFRAKGTTDFYCFNFDVGLNGFKLWKRVANQFTDLKVVNHNGVKLNTTYNLKVQCDGTLIKCYVDGDLVIEYTDPSHSEGYIGFNTFNANASFSNIICEGGQIKSGGVRNNITGLGEMSCSNCYTEQYQDGSIDIINMNGGDAFALSETTKDNFTISADLTIESNGAIAYLLRATDINNFYCINIDVSARCVKFWKRVNGSAVVVFTETVSISSGKAYNLKVCLNNSQIDVYFCNNLIHSVSDDSFATGLIGFNSFNSSGTIQNLIISE